ncbi:integrase catalytic domain-containing protein [Trichonephila clavipes]|nr:integrase catalytic domain-containing protein [Trichonephila clavipes]
MDYAGPIITKPNLKASRVTLKSYIAIFICFSTKATHLEVVSDLTTEAFLACLQRFIARRSKPFVIWSDNATNFKGARNILNEWNEICKSNRIQLFSAEEGIEWNFIPPASPHFGGLWEANIKSMKRILLRVAKSAIMNFEELTTLMAQIEAVLNSRPLSALSSDPNDLNPLTPGHFLMNCAISSFPEPYTASDSLSYHSRWKLIQSLRDKFWNRWTTEYLTHLQTRAKWSVQNPNLMENQVVLLKNPNTKPLDWAMGRILEVFPGSDGLSYRDDCYVLITAVKTGERYKFNARNDRNEVPVRTLSNTTVTFYKDFRDYYSAKFSLTYTIKNLECMNEESFQCDDNFCIPQSKVCDGVNDCKNGSDEIGCETGVLAIQGVKEARKKAIDWMKRNRTLPWNWRDEMPRAVVALYLASDVNFNGTSLEEELMAKQAELKVALALLSVCMSIWSSFNYSKWYL